MDGVLLTGLFALACTLQDIEPSTGKPIGEPHAMSYIARDGTGTLIGWADLDGQEEVAAHLVDDGVIRLTGISFSNTAEPTWADIRQTGDNEFTIEWKFRDRLSVDSENQISVWSKGSCTQLATSQPGSKQ